MWASRNFLNNDVFASRIGTVIEEQAVQQALARFTTAEVMKLVDVENLIAEALPDQGQILAPTLAGAVEDFVRGKVEEVFATPEFAALFETVVNTAHQQAVDLLEGNKSEVVTASGDSVTLNFLPVINQVLAKIGDVSPEILGRDVGGRIESRAPRRDAAPDVGVGAAERAGEAPVGARPITHHHGASGGRLAELGDHEARHRFVRLVGHLRGVAASPSARLHGAGGSLVERFGSFLASLAPRQLAYSTLAAAMSLALLAGAVGMRLGSPQSGYEVATGPSRETQAGTFALISFQPAAPAATVSAFLADNKYAIVDGPRAGGIYRIRISETVLSKEEAEAALAKIKARGDLISFASSAPAN